MATTTHPFAREIVVDTETTGLNPTQGDRIVSVGAVELIGLVPTGLEKQFFVNPERHVPMEAQRIHGLTDEFLVQHPTFPSIAPELLELFTNARLIIHNASFDLRFLQTEFSRCGYPSDTLDHIPFVDTVELARSKYPNQSVSLDNLCRKFGISLEDRHLHGALLDAQLLAQVYVYLRGGSQRSLDLEIERTHQEAPKLDVLDALQQPPSPETVQAPLFVHRASETERQNHRRYLERIESPLWNAQDDTYPVTKETPPPSVREETSATGRSTPEHRLSLERHPFKGCPAAERKGGNLGDGECQRRNTGCLRTASVQGLPRRRA